MSNLNASLPRIRMCPFDQFPLGGVIVYFAFVKEQGRGRSGELKFSQVKKRKGTTSWKNCTFVKTNKKLESKFNGIGLSWTLPSIILLSLPLLQIRGVTLFYPVFSPYFDNSSPIIPCRALRDVAAYVLGSSCPLPPRSPRAAAAAAPSAPSAAQEEGFHSLFTRRGGDSIPSWIRHGGGPETMGDVWPGGRSPEAQEDNARW